MADNPPNGLALDAQVSRQKVPNLFEIHFFKIVVPHIKHIEHLGGCNPFELAKVPVVLDWPDSVGVPCGSENGTDLSVFVSLGKPSSNQVGLPSTLKLSPTTDV